ncbi:MAG: pyridoxamine 5'-phosphate oxidase family protein [bacterium]|nr:pyridoxamine 5'-phosphate oxidase family protein [bacterium]
MAIKINIESKDITVSAVKKSLDNILNKNILCSIATIRDKNSSHINTAYFCYSSDYEFYFLSDPSSQHVLNLTENQSTAIAIYESSQKWGTNLMGLQMFGTCSLVKKLEIPKSYLLYAKRFHNFTNWIKHPNELVSGIKETKLYKFTPKKFKIFDEPTFGKDEYVSGIFSKS